MTSTYFTGADITSSARCLASARGATEIGGNGALSRTRKMKNHQYARFPSEACALYVFLTTFQLLDT